MSGRIERYGDTYRDLFRALKAAGFTPDQADEAARLAERVLRERRDELIRLSFVAGHSVRTVARIWGVSKSRAHQIRDGIAGGCPPTRVETGQPDE